MSQERVRRLVLARIEVNPETGCWEWQLHRDRQGYGRATIDSQKLYAHRVAYEAWVGPIPDGLAIDHLCRNQGCCNPEHLEAVTNAENLRRQASHRTTCDRGHAYTPENTYYRHDRPGRLCRTCGADRARARRAARHDARSAIKEHKRLLEERAA